MKTQNNKLIFYSSMVISIGVTVFIFWFRKDIENYKEISYGAVFLLSFLTHLTVIIPGPTYGVAIAMGAVLNPFAVGGLMGAGAAFGESLSYWMGRLGFSAILPFGSTLLAKLKTYGTSAIFILALLPNPLFDVGAILAGSMGLPFINFFCATAAGKAIRFFLVAGLSKTIYRLV